MRLTLNFRTELDGVSTWITQQLDSLIGQIKGAWGVEHTDDGHHSDVTATTVTTTGNVVIGGYMTANGNVTADLDGSPVIIGTTSQFDVGVDMKKVAASNWWSMGVELGQFSAQPSIIWRDIANKNTVASVMALRRIGAVGVTDYALQPTSVSVAMLLGRDTLGERWSEVNANTIRALLGYFERGRTTAAGAWQSYTPTLISGGGAITLGNGTLAGKYTEVGKTVDFRIWFYPGTTTNIPAGALFFGTPTTAIVAGTQSSIGEAHVQDSGVTNYLGLTCLLVNANVFSVYNSAGTIVTNAFPMTFADGDFIIIRGSYEEA